MGIGFFWGVIKMFKNCGDGCITPQINRLKTTLEG